jgi:hypothetical protein
VLARVIVAVALITGCADAPVDEEDLGDDDVVLDDPDPDGKADGATKVWFTPITKEYFLPSAKVAGETRKLFKSEAEWVEYFGQPSPGIDFTHQWAIFYTPGTQTPGLATTPGWRARFARVSLSATGKTLSITTRLELNGEDCDWRSARPFVTATIEKPASNPAYKRFYRSDTTRECP